VLGVWLGESVGSWRERAGVAAWTDWPGWGGHLIDLEVKVGGGAQWVTTRALIYLMDDDDSSSHSIGVSPKSLIGKGLFFSSLLL
jgi:hypothetical protein